MKKTLLICFMALMSVAMFAQDEENVVRLYAHRGGMGEADQNTLTAFNAAYKAGYRGFETDIRLTMDGEFVILHDSALEELANGKGNVETTKASAIKKLRVGKSKVLFLDELLEWIAKKGDIEYFEFELKTDPSLYTDELVQQMSETLYHKIMANRPIGATFLITSSDTRPLMFLKEKFSEANLMLITPEPVNNTTITKVKELGLKRMASSLNGTSREAVEKAHREGITINLWPTNDIEDIALAVCLGADAVCTDIPAAAKKGLKDQLKWVVIEY